MRKYSKSIACFLFFFLLVVPIIMPAASVLAASAAKTVRVGYYSGDLDFQDGFSDDERKSGYAYEYYQELARLAGWHYEYVYGTREEVFDLLLEGKVDVIAGVYQTEKRKAQVLFSKYDMGLDGEERYFAVNKNRTDILEELNDAQENLLATSPYFTVMLWQEYYSQDANQQILTDSEKKWLEQKGSLNIGYVRYNLPLSDQDGDGQPIGVIKDLVSLFSSYLRIPLNPVCYETMTEMEAGLQNGEIDAAFPVYSDLWVSESKGFFQTDSIISDRVMIVYKGSYRDDLMDKIALSETGIGQRYYLSIYYPDSETVFYGSREEAFAAIQAGETNCMIGCASILQQFLKEHTEYQDFNIAYLDTTEDFGLAVIQGENQLAGILNKAIRQIDDGTLTSALIQYSAAEDDYTFKDFLRRYYGIVILILCVIFAVLFWTFLSYRHKTTLYNEEQAKTRLALNSALDAANAANKAKSTFLSSMSHDIRTPMNGIIGMTSIAYAHIDDQARVKDCLAKISSSSRHLLALINEVLDMSKIESGSIHINEETVDLSSLMDDLITLNRPQADAKHQEMVVHTIHISHEQVIGDALRLQQIFTNLVSNAVKYTPDGGKIEITLCEKPSGKPKIASFEFTVKDNGIGMDEDYLPHIFEAFTRADNESTAKIQGTGLGMAITHNLVHMMNGNISVESALGEGSKFTVNLFLKTTEADTGSYEEFAGLSVLIIDDDKVVCESACLLLSNLGMHGEWAGTGREGIGRVTAHHEDGTDYFAVLVDWQIPDMDGLSVIREIRQRVGQDLPIAVISSHDWPAIKEQAADVVINGFIGKPLFQSRLVHLFHQLLGKESEASGTGLRELTANTDFSGKRALLVEDNELNAEIAMEILGMTGLEIQWASNGKEAVQQMETCDPGYFDCIFMDVQMPVMDGINATKAIRSLPRPDAAAIPIFAMTANAFAEDIRAVLDAGMDEHISKPLNIDQLLKILNQYLT